MKNEIKQTAHSSYQCEYHIVFAPKYRRKIIYKELRQDIIDMLQVMPLLMIAKQAPIRIPEFTPIRAAVIFPLLAIRKNMIGCLFRLNTQVIPPFPLVIIFGTLIPAGGLLYWAVRGVAVLVRVLSVGVWIMLLLLVIGLSAGGWCMYPPKKKQRNTVEQILNN